MDAEILLEDLRASVRREVGDAKKVAISYSGGLDSSIIAALASELTGVECYTWAVKGSFDEVNAASWAREEGVSFHLNLLEPNRLKLAVASASEALGSFDPIQLSYSVPIVLVVEDAREKVILVGSGADELFGGYSRYTSLADPSADMASDFEKMLREADRLGTWAERRGKRLGFPFAGDEITRRSRELPMSRKISGGERKVVLRDVAKILGLPSHDRPKKAAQYSSGVLKLMQRTAKGERVDLDRWVKDSVCGPGRKQL